MKQTTIEEDPTVTVEAKPEALVLASEVMAPPATIPRQSGLMALASQPDALQLIKTQEEILRQIRLASLRLTGPGDWVAMKQQGAADATATCLLRNSGARKIAHLWMVSVTAAQPTTATGKFDPEITKGEDGEVQVTAWCEATSGLTGETIQVTANRSNLEDFVGRGVQKKFKDTLVGRADLKQSVHTALHTISVRNLAGMKSVPIADLIAVNLKFDEITKGSGFGTGSDRGASAVTSEDDKASRDKLRDEIMRRVGGDKAAARDLLKNISSGPNFDGFDSIDRLTKDWQIKNAWSALKTHEVFGDAAQGNGGGE